MEMQISQYDEYIPEKELDMNFKIPRKRTAEESFGSTASRAGKTSCYDSSATNTAEYGNSGFGSGYSSFREGTSSYSISQFNTSLKYTTMPPMHNQSFDINELFHRRGQDSISYPLNSMNLPNVNVNMNQRGFESGPFWQRNLSSKPIGPSSNGAPVEARLGGINSFSKPTMRPNDVQSLGQPFGWNNSNSRGSFKGTNSFVGGDNRFGNNQTQRSFSNGHFSNRTNAIENQTANKANTWKPGPNTRGKQWNKKDEKIEYPKTSMKPVMIPDATDQTLPKELREMFQALYCKLCSLQMTSNVMARMHYVSKNHEKKIRKYLIELAEKTGEPLHPRAAVTNVKKEKKEEDKDPKNYYCSLCDLQLTGKQHADSHYMGKSHNAVRMGLKKPAGRGFYNADGNWIRKSNNSEILSDDPFGMDFRKKEEDQPPLVLTEKTKPKPSGTVQEKFTCSLCSVSCVSEDQLNIHFTGAKHKKKLKLNGLSPENFTIPQESEQATSSASTVKGTSQESDELKTKFMTPNGYFYCKDCNLTVNSELQFKQHLQSKNHAKKAKKIN